MKRLISSLLVVIMLMTTLITAMPVTTNAYTSRTREEAKAWIVAAANNHYSYDYDRDGYCWCTEFVYTYYNYLGATPPLVNAGEFGYQEPPNGWKVIPYYSGFSAQPGDIAVFLGPTWAGHVALVIAANEWTMDVAEQNYNYQQYVTPNTYWYSDYSFYGVIRPDFPEYSTYTISYNANGGSGAPSSQTKTHGVSLTLSSTKPTRSGYTFTGWNTKANGTGTSYSAGGSYTVNASVTLYAQWKVNHTHSYTSKQTKDPTCTQTGVMTYTCSCGDSYTSTIAAKGHYWGYYQNDFNATCTKNGTQTSVCSNGCGTKNTTELAGSALGHSFTDYTGNGDATCVKDGTKSAKCDRCRAMNTVTDTGSATGNHSYGSWSTVVKPTYVSEGEQRRYCTVCNAVNSGIIAKLVPDITVDANVVKITGAEYLDYIRYASGTHENSDSIRNAPDCIGIGETKIKAGTVNGVFEKPVTPEGTYSFWIRLTDGSTYIQTVKVGKPLHSHSYTSKITKKATCTENGIKTYTCTCGDSYTEAIDKIAHKFTNYVYENNGACAMPSMSTATEAAYCDYGCGTVDRYEVPPRHIIVEWATYKPATYFETGEEIGHCINCSGSHGGGYYEFRTIPMLVFEGKFSDIKESHWFYSSVEFVVKHGYMNGMSETKFSPNSNITREQFVLILANIAGVDTNAYKNESSGFTDVKTGQWYSGAVTWAVKEGYVSGMSATKFGRGQSIQRAALARMLYNYASANGIDVSGRADLSSFGDAKEFDKAGNAWMVEPVQWAVDAGIISGMTVNGKNCVNPKGTATRAQAARMLMQFDALMK